MPALFLATTTVMFHVGRDYGETENAAHITPESVAPQMESPAHFDRNTQGSNGPSTPLGVTVTGLRSEVGG